MSADTLALSPELLDYLRSVSLREPTILKQLRLQNQLLETGFWQISPEQGQFMSFLIELLQPRLILELGTFTGYSTLAMALALPPEGRILTCDIGGVHTDTAQRYWKQAGVSDKITLYLGQASETLRTLESSWKDKVDLAFIDVDKAGVAVYYEACLKLVRVDGLILIDNTLMNGRVLEPSVDPETTAMHRFNQSLVDDPRVSISLLPIGDGLTLVRRRI